MDIGFLLFLGLQALSLGLDRGSYSLVGGLAASALISYSANKVYRGAGQYSFMGLWPLASYGIYKYSQKINELLEESNSILTPLNYELLQEIGLIDSHGASLLDQHKINPLPEIPIIAGEKNDISLLFLHLAVNWSMEFRYISAKDISDPEILKLSPTVFALDKHEASALSQEDIVKFYNSCQDKHRLLIMAENDGSPVQSSYIKIHKPHVFNQSLVLQALLKNYNHKYINKKLFLKQTKDLNFLKFYHLILSVKRYALRDGTNIIYPHYIEQALSVQDDKLSTIGSYNQDNIKEWLSDIALNHHHNRNIQHGILIHGPLSTDKVSLSLEIAAGLDFDTYLLDMNRYLSYFYKNDFSSVNNYFNTLREAAERDSSINHILILNGLDNLVNLRISDNEVAIIELLAQLNILSGYKNIFIIGIAGSFERIDPRILDLSYFKHTIQVSLPNQAEREVIFNNYIKAHDQLDRDSSISTLASMTNGWSGKAIIEMLDETITQAKSNKVTQSDIMAAIKLIAKSTIKEQDYNFDKIAGAIPQEIRDIPNWIADPERFTSLGARMPKGILLVGSPGTGKTSIARALAGEAGAQFFAATGTSFVKKFAGEGPQAVRDLFEKAKNCSGKAIVFIDEIDAIGGKRHEAISGSDYEYRSVLNELLSQMDGFSKNTNVFVIAATNTVHDLDPALLRPGRFDNIITIPLPDLESRKKILLLYAGQIKHNFSQEVFDLYASITQGWSGADLEKIINESAIIAARERAECVDKFHLEKSYQKHREQKRDLLAWR